MMNGCQPRVGLGFLGLRPLGLLVCLMVMCGCDNEVGSDRNGAGDACGVCTALASYADRTVNALGKDNRFGRTLLRESQRVIAEGGVVHAFLLTPPALVSAAPVDACETRLRPQLDAWLPVIEAQAEKVADKKQRCVQSCPQVNCGEYVDFVGMNSERLELMTVLENRLMDAALAGAYSSGTLGGREEERLQSLRQGLQEQFATGVALINQLSEQMRSAPQRAEVATAYPEQLLAFASTLDERGAVLIGIEWAQHDRGVVNVAPTLATLASYHRQLGEDYALWLASETATQDIALIERMAKVSIQAMGTYHHWLIGLANSDALSNTSSRQTSSQTPNRTLACYETLTVSVGVAKELYSLASETVAQCALQLSCKTHAHPVYDAIVQASLSTDNVLTNLGTIQDMADKVIYSYTSAACR